MMNFLKKRLNKKGFTLVELLIVIAVLGIIAGIGVTSMSGITDTFKKKADTETAKMLARVVEVQIMAGNLNATEHDTGAKITAQTSIAKDFATAKSQTNPGTPFIVSDFKWTTGEITISWAKTGDAANSNVHTETIAFEAVK